MKTFIFENAGKTLKVAIKCDVFATNAQLQEPGFDTRFTAMTVEDSDEAIQAGLNINEMEQNLQGLKAKATELGWSLSVADINEEGGTIELVAAV